jgi:hypothetical protein
VWSSGRSEGDCRAGGLCRRRGRVVGRMSAGSSRCYAGDDAIVDSIDDARHRAGYNKESAANSSSPVSQVSAWDSASNSTGGPDSQTATRGCLLP